MNTQSLSKVGARSLLFVLVIALVGCATSGHERGQKIGTALRISANEIEVQEAKLSQAVAELNELVNNPQTDLRPQFHRFSTTLGKQGTLSRTIAHAQADMEARGRGYFENWDKELVVIQNETIRTRSQARRNEVQGNFYAVRRRSDDVQKQVEPLEADLADVRRFLNNDLTPAGIAAIKEPATRVNQMAGPVHEAVIKLANDMRALGNSMTPLNSLNPPPAHEPSK